MCGRYSQTANHEKLSMRFDLASPVILRPKDEERWLDPGLADAAKLATLLRPYPAGDMEAYAVSTRVNSPRNDGPECIDALNSGSRV